MQSRHFIGAVASLIFYWILVRRLDNNEKFILEKSIQNADYLSYLSHTILLNFQ